MTRAIYAGSFDPITCGHVDIVMRAKKLFEEVVIGVIQNPEKEPFFPLSERIALIRQVFDGTPGIEIEGFQGLLVNFAQEKQVFTLVRGLRAVSDFDFEFQMALTNRSLNPQMDTVFLMTDHAYSYLSSSLVKQLAQLGADVSPFVPAQVKIALEKKCHD